MTMDTIEYPLLNRTSSKYRVRTVRNQKRILRFHDIQWTQTVLEK